MDCRVTVIVLSVLIGAGFPGTTRAAAKKKPRYTKAPGANLRQPIIWGAECINPDGLGLAFGGHEQAAADGRPHTPRRQQSPSPTRLHHHGGPGG